MCIYRCAHVTVCVWRSEDTLSADPSFLPYLRQGLFVLPALDTGLAGL